VKVGFRPFVAADQLTIRQVMPFTFGEGTNGIVAFNRETHRTLAVLVAQEWTYTSCTAHQVILNPLVIRHGWFQEIADWLFDRANRIALYAPVPSNNERAIKFNEKLGFREVIRLKDAYDRGIDFVIMELRPENANPKLWQRQELPDVVNG
jgi:hypothetical protein